ncbi:MAG TPA: hypothetical protein VMI75_22800 [Polyangiaceae bacterium]|nr:hypothetical protein [Polyangiaceae bacterium]
MRLAHRALALAVGAMLLSCRDQVPVGGQLGDGGSGGSSGTGASVAIGAACIPSQELSTTFLGFDEREVVLDEGNDACGSGVCLVNHYRGRVTCPYGQNATATGAGLSPTGANEPCKGTKPGDQNSACCTPGSDRPVLASQDVGSAMPTQSQVQPACPDRPSAKTVTCSCRCANAAGKTDDGAQYCSCPGGFACTQVVPELTVGDPLAGAYCIANGTAYDSLTSCTGLAGCDPTTKTGLPGYCGPTNAAETTTSADAGAEMTYFWSAFTGGQTCLPFAPPTDASGKATCVALMPLADAGSCSDTPGLTATDPAIVKSVQQDMPTLMIPQNLCEVPQLAAPCATGMQAGWCNVTGANLPPGCASQIDFTMGLPAAGSFIIFGCY